jgi:hypothetical protein
MQAEAAEIDSGCQPDAKPKGGSKARLLSLADIDRRTRAYQRTAELIASVESDLGGSERLSTGERQIVQRAAVTGALIEDLEARWLSGEGIDPATYCTLSNAQRRLFETVGLKRQPRDVSGDIESWAAQKAAEKAARAANTECAVNNGTAQAGAAPLSTGAHSRGECERAGNLDGGVDD